MLNRDVKTEINIDEAFNYFVTLVEDAGTPVEEAFRDAFDYLLETFTGSIEENRIEKAYEKGRETGIIDAYEMIGLSLIEASDTATELSKMNGMSDIEDECDDCTCDGECFLDTQSLEAKIIRKKK